MSPTAEARCDRRALTPLFWTHINLYGKFDLDMSTLLDLASAAPVDIP